MKDVMWIYAFILLLSEAWSMGTGTNQSTSVSSNISLPKPVPRYLDFNQGSDANLTCSNKKWNETIFVIWNIDSKNKQCRISLNNDGQSQDLCNDSKSLRNTSSAQSYLHIPNFSEDDVGLYKCEWVYKGGTENYEIHVGIKVQPSISSWLEPQDNKMVAVCRAEGGKPAANISWSHMGNSSVEETQLDSRGFFTVESRLKITEGMDTENLSCVVSHPFWPEKQTLRPDSSKRGNVSLLCIPAVGVIVVFLAGFLCFARKKLMLRRSQQSDTSPSKSTPTEDVEEVEPYASYVQRVNSIYNSSADLFT